MSQRQLIVQAFQNENCRAHQAQLDNAGAIMRGAKLKGANLTLMSLRDANLTKALMWETILARSRNQLSRLFLRNFKTNGRLPYTLREGTNNILEQG